MTSPPSHDHESLLAQTGWVRALARSLVSEWDLAEDLAQDTWMTALRHPLPEEGSLRSWLHKVMRNLLRQRFRRECVRAVHEREGGGDATAPGADEVAETVEAHHKIVEAVLALDEPYRDTIMMRYFSGLSQREIASRLGIPPATVNSRHTRGMARLREGLERKMGRRRAWIAVLPLTERPTLISAASIGALLMSTQIKLLASVALLLGSVVVLNRMFNASDAVVVGEERATVVDERKTLANQEEGIAGSVGVRSSEREALEASSPPEVSNDSTEPALGERLVRGKVLDVEGQTVAGIRVELVRNGGNLLGGLRAEMTTESESDGSFELRPQRSSGILVTRSPEWSTVLACDYREASAGTEHVIVVAPKRPLAGHVVDEYGKALEGATVSIHLPPDILSRFDVILDQSERLRWMDRTDQAGKFDLPDAPWIEGASITARLTGYSPYSEHRAPAAMSDIRIVMTDPEHNEGELAGQVIDMDGVGVAHALLRLGSNRTTSDEDGMFRLTISDVGSQDPVEASFERDPMSRTLVAIHEGYLPALIAPSTSGEQAVWPEFLIVELDGPAPSINGRVFSADGRPLSGIGVWIADPMEFEYRREDGQMLPILVEDVVAGRPGEYFRPVSTDSEGRFAIENLMQRSYRLVAMDPRTLLRVDALEVEAGEEHLEIHFPEDGVYERVSGRIVSRAGVPLAGVTVTIDTYRLRLRALWVASEGGGSVSTDESGRFELRDVPKRFAHLLVESRDILPLRFGGSSPDGLTNAGDVEKLEIVVSARCHFRIQVSVEGAFDHFQVLDEEEQPMAVSLFQGSTRTHSSMVEIRDQERTNIMIVAEEARTIVLLKDGSEVKRQELQLVPGEVNLVQL